MDRKKIIFYFNIQKKLKKTATIFIIRSTMLFTFLNQILFLNQIIIYICNWLILDNIDIDSILINNLLLLIFLLIFEIISSFYILLVSINVSMLYIYFWKNEMCNKNTNC